MVEQRSTKYAHTIWSFICLWRCKMRVYIACSNRDYIPLEYRELASEVAFELAKRGHKLVFDGYETGMMGKSYMTFKYEGAHTKAIVDIKDTDNLNNLEIDAYDVVTSAMQRMEKIYKTSELVVILPGGISTLAEMMTFLDEIRIRQRSMRIILYNYNHYFSPIIKFLKDAYKNKFITAQELKLFDIVTDMAGLKIYLNHLDNERKDEDD